MPQVSSRFNSKACYVTFGTTRVSHLWIKTLLLMLG
jgi:hypothetical protein